MKIEVQKEWYSSLQCEKNPSKLYVFGDNTERLGMGGQAKIRNERNAVGLSTKDSCGEYFSDNNFEKNKKYINDDIFFIKERILNDMYEVLVFPFAGFGTGLSNMQVECPRTFLYLSERLLDEFNYNNLESLKTL